MNYWTRQLKAHRQEWSRNSPARKECFAQAKVIPFQTKDLPKWLCAECDESFALSDVQCDHIIPIANTTPQTMEEYFECVRKLDVDVSGLQILCKSCHKLKTKEEARGRVRETFFKTIHKYISPSPALDSLDTTILKKFNTAILRMESEGMSNRGKWAYEKLCEKYL